jgi:ABC-type uncharacterized transport system permease subunit
MNALISASLLAQLGGISCVAPSHFCGRSFAGSESMHIKPKISETSYRLYASATVNMYFVATYSFIYL